MCSWLFANRLQAQEGQPSRAGTPDGKRSYGSSCAGCHGLDGRGSDRAPDIATAREVRRLNDEALLRIVRNGIDGTGMPPFRSLGETRIKAIVAYLRQLQGRVTAQPLPGDPVIGKTLFNGKAKCSECHAVQGAGGFIGSDLTNYADTRSADQIRKGVLNPSAANPANTLLTVTMPDGRKLTGVARNEDNFSLQLATPDGAFHSVSKSDSQIERTNQPIMPTDYVSRLTPRELDDIVSYLISAAGDEGRVGNRSRRIPHKPEVP